MELMPQTMFTLGTSVITRSTGAPIPGQVVGYSRGDAYAPQCACTVVVRVPRGTLTWQPSPAGQLLARPLAPGRPPRRAHLQRIELREEVSLQAVGGRSCGWGSPRR